LYFHTYVWRQRLAIESTPRHRVPGVGGRRIITVVSISIGIGHTGRRMCRGAATQKKQHRTAARRASFGGVCRVKNRYSGAWRDLEKSILLIARKKARCVGGRF
jgi:hypothetical protein